jgi:glycosyltransferase involved in cell wall biosynthesis
MPLLSIIVIFYNMKREAPRTLFTLSSDYQQNVESNEYEVIVIDNGSKEPLNEDLVKSFGPNFHLIRRDTSPSPAQAMNAAVEIAKGSLIMLCIDGARMLSPRIISYTLKAFKAFDNPIVATPAYHLGPKLQNISMTEGYNQDTEDRLLETINWEENGYSLFQIACLAGSSRGGWFLPLSESNCITLPKSQFIKLKGFDERFISPGGGYVNLDFYKRACEATSPLVMLFGEGTFHQFHGGVATNVPQNQHPGGMFHDEYVQLRRKDFNPPDNNPVLFGELSDESLKFLNYSVDRLNEVKGGSKSE